MTALDAQLDMVRQSRLEQIKSQIDAIRDQLSMCFDQLSDGAYYQECHDTETLKPDLDYARKMKLQLEERFGRFARVGQRNHRVEIRLACPQALLEELEAEEAARG